MLHLTARVAAADAAIEPHRHRPPMQLAPVAGFADLAAATRWLRTQWPVAVEVIARARDAGLLEPCWQLGFLLRGFFFREKLTEPWLRSGRLGLAAACAKHPEECAVTLGELGRHEGAGPLHSVHAVRVLACARLPETVDALASVSISVGRVPNDCSSPATDSANATEATSTRAMAPEAHRWIRLRAGSSLCAPRCLQKVTDPSTRESSATTLTSYYANYSIG